MSGENVQNLEDELAELDQVSAPVVDIAEPVEPEVAAPETEAPEEKEVSVPEPAEPVPVEPAAVVEPPAPVETKPETSQVEELMKQVDMLSQQILQLQTKVPQPQTKSDTPEKLPEVEVYDYLEGIDIDDVTTDPKLFNTVLSKIEARVRGVLAEETTRSTLLAIPDVVQYQIKQQAALDELVKEFYDSNNDLKPVKHTVAMVAQNVSSEHPDWTVKQVFEESAKKTREILKLNVPNGLATSAEPLKPAFADHAKAHSKNVVQLSELQKQLDDL